MSEDLIQLGRAYGLAEIAIHPGREAGFAVAMHRIGGHGDDRDVLAARFGTPDHARGLESIHHRHLAIHQHKVVGVGSLDDCVHGSATIRNGPDGISQPIKLQEGQTAVDRVVFCQENPRARQRRRDLAFNRSPVYVQRLNPEKIA